MRNIAYVLTKQQKGIKKQNNDNNGNKNKANTRCCMQPEWNVRIRKYELDCKRSKHAESVCVHVYIIDSSVHMRANGIKDRRKNFSKDFKHTALVQLSRVPFHVRVHAQNIKDSALF